MNQREYESALKDVLEALALVVEEYEPNYLRTVHMPHNVPSAKRVSVLEWLDLREEKRDREAR